MTVFLFTGFSVFHIFSLVDAAVEALVSIFVPSMLTVITCNKPSSPETQFPGQKQDMGKGGPKGRTVLAPEFGDPIVIGMAVGGDEAHRHIAVGRLLDAAREENTAGITINQKRQHHPRMLLRLAASRPADAEGRYIDPLGSFHNERPWRHAR